MQQRTARQLNTGREHNHNATLVPTLDISLFLTLTSSPSLFFILSFFCIAAIRLEQAGRPSWRDHSHQEPRAMWRLLVRWCRSICLLFPAHRGDKKAACWCHASTRCHHLPFKLTAWLCVAACCCWAFFLGTGHSALWKQWRLLGPLLGTSFRRARCLFNRRVISQVLPPSSSSSSSSSSFSSSSCVSFS